MFVPSQVNGGNASLTLLPHHRFPKTTKFTDFTLVHGRWANNTLDAATKSQDRNRRLRERNMRESENRSNRFHSEVQKIERIQETLRTRQRRIAQAILRACCAIVIQATWRRFRAKVFARQCRARVLGTMISRLWQRYRLRRSMHILKRFIIRGRRDLKRKKGKAARMLQTAFRRHIMRKGLRRAVVASAATEAVITSFLDELVGRAHFESVMTVVQRLWRKRRIASRGGEKKEPQGHIFVTQQASRSSRRGRLRSLASRAVVLSSLSSNLSRKWVATTHLPKTRSPHLAPTPSTLRVMACAAAGGDTVGQNRTSKKRQSTQIDSFARENKVRDSVTPSSSGCTRLGSTHATVGFCEDPNVSVFSVKGGRGRGGGRAANVPVVGGRLKVCRPSVEKPSKLPARRTRTLAYKAGEE